MALQPVERMAWQWWPTNEKAMDDIDGLEGCRTVRYEDFCRNPRRESARKLFDAVGLAWSTQTEGFIRQSTSVNQERYFGVFKDPTVLRGEKWREQLAADECPPDPCDREGEPSGRLYPGD